MATTPLALLLAAAAVTACSHIPLAQKKAGTVKGVILSNADFAPVAGANILIDGKRSNTTTDSAGNFSFDGISAGRHTLQVRMNGFRDASPLNVDVGESVATCTILFLQPPASAPPPEGMTNAAPAPLLVMNGELRPGLLQMPHPPGPGVVIQIRNTLLPHIIPSNVKSVEVVHPDVAVQRYGQQGALGALVINTVPQASCASSDVRNN